MTDTKRGVKFRVVITRNLHGTWFLGDRWSIRVYDAATGAPAGHHRFHEANTRWGARRKALKACRAASGMGAVSERWTYEATAPEDADA